MTKLIGAILLISGTSACGLLHVRRLRRRSRILSEIVCALAAMRSEIVTRLTPVPELMERMALQTAVPVSSFFRNIHARLGELGSVALYDIWAQTIDAAPELLLSQEERAALRELARSLGRYDAAEQRAALERAERSFEEFARRADERRGADSKTFAALGAAAGVFIVLILI